MRRQLQGGGKAGVCDYVRGPLPILMPISFAVFSGHNPIPEADEIIERSYDVVIGGLSMARAARKIRRIKAFGEPVVDRTAAASRDGPRNS